MALLFPIHSFHKTQTRKNNTFYIKTGPPSILPVGPLTVTSPAPYPKTCNYPGGPSLHFKWVHSSSVVAPSNKGGEGLKGGRFSLRCSMEMSDLHFGHSKFESKLMYPHLGHFMESPHPVRDLEKQGHQKPNPHP
jgi:hypothetical protein